MSYERKDIPKLIVEFQEAKLDIAGREGCNYFLCNALKRREQTPQNRQAVEIVSESLGDHYTLNAWLKENGVSDLGEATHKRLRVQWCSKIIADLQGYAK